MPLASSLIVRIGTPDSGAVVMGTGIVSVALDLDGRHLLSAILLAAAGAVWVGLAVVVVVRLLADRRGLWLELRQPGALTSVAASCVLGTRLDLAGWRWAGVALLIASVAAWLVVMPPVLWHWRTPSRGTSFMLTVATESVALLAATVGLKQHLDALLYASLAPLLLGLAFYPFVLSRFAFRELLVGAGDHWVTGGALAICTLAAADVSLFAERNGMLTAVRPALRTGSLALWCLTATWLPALLVTEAARPRLAYHVLRWATVFPVGMYAACSFAIGRLTGIGAITDFARVWVWVAAAVWLVVSAATTARAGALVAGDQVSSPRNRRAAA
jgi:tellurite resistance protein TehA-like permease